MDIFSHREVIDRLYFSPVVRDVFRAGVVFVNPYEVGGLPSLGAVHPCIVATPSWVLEGWSVGGEGLRAGQDRSFVEVVLSGIDVEAHNFVSEHVGFVPVFLTVRGEVGEYAPVLYQRDFTNVSSLCPGMVFFGGRVPACNGVRGTDSGLRLSVGKSIPAEVGAWSGVFSGQGGVCVSRVEICERGVGNIGALSSKVFQVPAWSANVEVQLGSCADAACVFDELDSGFEVECSGRVLDDEVLSYGCDVSGVVESGKILIVDSGVNSGEVLQGAMAVVAVPENVSVPCVELECDGEVSVSPDAWPIGGVRVGEMFAVEERVGDVEVCSVVRESEWDVSGVLDLGLFDSVERLSLSSLGVAPRFIDAEVSVLSRDKKKTDRVDSSGLSLRDFQA